MTVSRRTFLRGTGLTVASAAAAGLLVTRGRGVAFADTTQAVEDTYLEKAKPTATHGADSVLLVKGPSASEKWALIKFLPTTSGAAQVRVKFAAVAAGTVSIMAAPSSAWSEGTVNWNTRPLPPGAVLDTETIPGAGQTVTFDVGQVTAGQLVSFYVQSSNTTKDIKLYARFGTAGPELITGVPPTTTTVAPTTTTAPPGETDTFRAAYGSA